MAACWICNSWVLQPPWADELNNALSYLVRVPMTEGPICPPRSRWEAPVGMHLPAWCARTQRDGSGRLPTTVGVQQSAQAGTASHRIGPTAHGVIAHKPIGHDEPAAEPLMIAGGMTCSAPPLGGTDVRSYPQEPRGARRPEVLALQTDAHMLGPDRRRVSSQPLHDLGEMGWARTAPATSGHIRDVRLNRCSNRDSLADLSVPDGTVGRPQE